MSPEGQHRATVRPRYGRLSALGGSVAVVMVALLGGTGIIPAASEPGVMRPAAAVAVSTPPVEPTVGPVLPSPPPVEVIDESVPADSGTGRRVVFSESRQRVWLMTDTATVADTYLVSGSIYDNLDPGTFEVFSRSVDAFGIDDSGTMKFFVRFTRGPSGAAIGFHDIPIKDGQRIQRFDELGTPLSHGCIRQKRSDAISLWKFAPLGTAVVVTA